MPIVAILGKIARFRLSQASYHYPEETRVPGIYRCDGQARLDGQWKGLLIRFTALFHDKEGQRCRIERGQREEYLSITCRSKAS